MENYKWLIPELYRIVVDHQKQPILNQDGHLLIVENESNYLHEKKILDF